MQRVVFSLYIDIPKKDLDLFDSNILKEGHTPTNYRTKDQFKIHYGDLVASKEIYANKIGADFKMFEYDTDWILYSEKLKEKYPYLTAYNIVNFYKIHLLYELSKKYDEILYLDFDVVPMKYDNFFEHWDLTKGIAVLNNNNKINTIEQITDTSQTIRSPSSKYYNAQAMLFELGLSTKNDVINTGIIGINKDHLQKLDYFGKFEDNLTLMKHLKIQTKEEVIIPDYEQYTADLKYIEKKNKKLEKEYEKKMLENAEELSKQQVELDAVAAEKQKLIDEMNELKGVKTEKKSQVNNNSPK